MVDAIVFDGMKKMWNERYAVSEYVFGTEPNQFLREQLKHLKPNMQLLSVADGEGRNGVWLAEQGMLVLSVDASEVAQQKAVRLAAERKVVMQIECVDLLQWDWGIERFDAVVAIFIQFVGAQEREKIFSLMKQALKPGGVLLLQGYTPRQLDYRTGGPSNVDNLYTAPMLRALLAGWEVLHWAEHDSVINEGKGHAGMSALIDVVVRKPML